MSDHRHQIQELSSISSIALELFQAVNFRPTLSRFKIWVERVTLISLSSRLNSCKSCSDSDRVAVMAIIHFISWYTLNQCVCWPRPSWMFMATWAYVTATQIKTKSLFGRFLLVLSWLPFKLDHHRCCKSATIVVWLELSDWEFVLLPCFRFSSLLTYMCKSSLASDAE